MSKKSEVEAEIRTLHKATKQYLENKALQNKLKYRHKRWYDRKVKTMIKNPSGCFK